MNRRRNIFPEKHWNTRKHKNVREYKGNLTWKITKALFIYFLSFVINLLDPWIQDHTSEESDGWGQRQIARLPDCQVETFELQLFGNFGHICGPLVLQLFHIPMMMMDNVGDGDGDDKSHLLFYSHLSLPWNVLEHNWSSFCFCVLQVCRWQEITETALLRFLKTFTRTSPPAWFLRFLWFLWFLRIFTRRTSPPGRISSRLDLLLTVMKFFYS